MLMSVASCQLFPNSEEFVNSEAVGKRLMVNDKEVLTNG
jgi:hypothetical protein